MAFSFPSRWQQQFIRHSVCVGLDIAASSVRVSAVRKCGSTHRVEAMASENTLQSPGLDAEGHLGELEPLVDHCRKLISKLGRARSLSMAIPLHAATCVRLTLPSSSTPTQRLRQIRAELAGYLAYPVNEASIDFTPLIQTTDSPRSASHPDDLEIIAVAVPQSMIDERLALADALQLQVGAIGIDAWMVAELASTCLRCRHTATVHVGRESAWLALSGQPPALLARDSHATLLKNIAGQIGALTGANRLQRVIVCGDGPGLASLVESLRKYAGIPAALGCMPASFRWTSEPQRDDLARFHTALSIAAGGLI